MKQSYVGTVLLVLTLLIARDAARAAAVNSTGYTNDFSIRPSAADWSTRGFGSTGTNGPNEIASIAELDAAVQTNSAVLITNQCPLVNGSPPINSVTAVWSTNAYLQTRPNFNAATLLMATINNNTLTNATIVRLSYDYATNRAALVAEEVRGVRVFYSLTGTAGSWSNIAELSQTAQGRLSVDLALAGTWGSGSNLYLLWADDNGSGSPDDANNLDNFFITIIGGTLDVTKVAPRIVTSVPTPGEVLSFNQLAVSFGERVSGVTAGDLLANGVAAASVTTADEIVYTFNFTQPTFGPVAITWATNHDIADFDSPSKPFDGVASGNTLQYRLVNPGAPTIATNAPVAGSTIPTLTQIVVSFSKPVLGVAAADLRINGAPASSVSGSGVTYTFTFPQPAYGAVAITWNASTNIRDFEGNAFDGTRPTNIWSYTLIDRTPPSIASQDPPAGSSVAVLTNVTVTFTEPVSGVNASDLLLNGIPAKTVNGSNATYTFTFAQLNATTVNVTWAANHGIRDLASPPNTALGEIWFYFTTDTVPPTPSIKPTPGATIRDLTRIEVTFDEAVTGVDVGDLLINNVPAQQVTGAAAGPYTFVFSRPATGAVQVAFAPGHNIRDLRTPPNLFPGAAWSYVLNPALITDIAVSRAVQISLDGLGAKYLEFYVNNAPAQFPTFVRLMNEAAFTFNARCDYDISETVPNHITMFTARPVFQPTNQANTAHHGYNNNFPLATDTLHNAGNSNVTYKASMFDVAHDYGRTTAFYAGKTRLDICDRSFNVTNGAPDLVGEDNGRDKIDFSNVIDIQGAAISNQVNTIIQDLTSASPKHYTFIHIAEPDLTGHASGWGSSNWSNIVRTVDAQLGRIIDAIDGNPVLANQTALIVTADHGGGGVTPNGHTESFHITNYTVPFFLRAPGIGGGTDLYTLFANRANPGTNRTDYTTQPQPIRNGDGSNLALALMALPPIPGSFIVPVLAAPGVSLSIARFDGRVAVFWPDPDGQYTLESADSLLPNAQWRSITNGVTVSDTVRTFTVTNFNSAPLQFFRLKKQ